MRLGFGVAAMVPHDVLGKLGGMLGQLGYDDVWSNDLGPGSSGDGLAALAALAGPETAGTARTAGSGLRLGLGVAALDRRSPAVLADAVEAHDLAANDLLLGVGAGFSLSPRKLLREGIEELRGLLPDDVHVGAAAMGPRVCRLAGEIADFVLLNWMTPDRIRWARRRIEEGARSAGRQPGDVEVAAYVRVAVGPDGAERLAAEAGRYASLPHYGRHFEAMGVDSASVGVAAQDPAEVAARLDPYRDVLDTLVVRALPANPALDAHLETAQAAV